MHIFILRENCSSIKIEKVLPNWRWSRPFSGKSPLTNFQTLAHQISLLAGLHTVNNPFHQRTKKEPILQHLDSFHFIFKFQINLDELPLNRGALTVPLITTVHSVNSAYKLFVDTRMKVLACVQLKILWDPSCNLGTKFRNPRLPDTSPSI